MLCCLSDASDGSNVGEKAGAASHCQPSALQALTALSLQTLTPDDTKLE